MSKIHVPRTEKKPRIHRPPRLEKSLEAQITDLIEALKMGVDKVRPMRKAPQKHKKAV